MNRDGLLRILDANFNRVREGLRVAEELVRFSLDDRSLQTGYKRLRDEVARVYGSFAVTPGVLVRSRASSKDVGRPEKASRMPRRDAADVGLANVERAKEALRVLEEFSKIVDPAAAVRFKEIRYDLYTLERRTLPKLEALRDHVSREASGTAARRSRGGGPSGRSRRRPAAR